MPQTSPMSWIMFSNLILFNLIINSSILSLDIMSKYNNKMMVNFYMKNWMW